ncbi:MAG: ferrous iron transport protein B [Peptococcaceae bacterium]|jgi:ferrous iron transport protein B|nr:ferrous iron transport protein B [Peptococcaceae bacterium]
MSIKIALAGNPNSGKTTLFNDLTGSSQYVGNWPGVTVEKKEGKLRWDKGVVIQDLPGIYSLSPYSLEEVVARNYLTKEQPDAIINITDASNLERNLYLTTQLLELGIPVVIALNMIDVVRKRGDRIDLKGLGAALGCEIVETSALKGIGSQDVANQAIALAQSGQPVQPIQMFSEPVESALAKISALIERPVSGNRLRWYAMKLFERDAEIVKECAFDASLQASIEAIITDCETALDDDSEGVIANERYVYIVGLMKQFVQIKSHAALSTSDKIDKIVTNRILGLPIFAAVIFAVYYIAISTVGTAMTDWVNDSLFGETIPGAIESFLLWAGSADLLNSLILDGIVAGVGAVLGFLPQMLVLFLLLAILEDCGYMARIAFVMDRIFRRFGLSGKSFIPILVGTGCGVPGIMASRTIENEKDRRMTVITTTFIPCGAKLPIIGLIVGAFFPESVWIAPATYFIGIAAIIVSGVILKKTRLFAGDPAPFVMELPSYHRPGPKTVLIHMWDRGKAFVKKAGTIILLACIVVWFLSTFSWSMQIVDIEDSILASIGQAIAPIFAPLGWGDWRATVATVTGLIAKENVVGTFGILYGYAEVAEDGAEYWPMLTLALTQLAAFSFLLFNLLCAPCFAAIGAIRNEMKSPKWTLFAVAYQTVFAYVIALMVYQFGWLLSGHDFGVGSIFAILCLAIMLFLLFRRPSGVRRQAVLIAESTPQKG